MVNGWWPSRLSNETRAELAGTDGMGPFEPMPGRPWKDYLHASATRWGGSEELADWALTALEHTAKMPAKVPKARKPKKG